MERGQGAAPSRCAGILYCLRACATAAESVNTMVEAAGANKGGGIVASIIGVATLLFAASGVFGELQDSLNTIWEVQPKPGQGFMSTIKQRFFSFAMVLGVGFLLLVSLLVS